MSDDQLLQTALGNNSSLLAGKVDKSQITTAIAAPGSDIKIPSEKAASAALALKAPLASPTFTGTPAAPTPAADTNSTQLATTAFVLGQAGTAAPLMDGTAAAGASKRYAPIDHVHPIGMTDATTTATAPVAGGAGALPATPAGYVTISINGTIRQIPYY